MKTSLICTYVHRMTHAKDYAHFDSFLPHRLVPRSPVLQPIIQIRTDSLARTSQIPPIDLSVREESQEERNPEAPSEEEISPIEAL